MDDKPLQIVRENEYSRYILVSKEYCEKVIKKLCVIYTSSKIFSEAYVVDKGYYKFNYEDLREIFYSLGFKQQGLNAESKDSESKRKNITNTYLYSLPYYSKRHKILKKCRKLQNLYGIYSFLDYIFSDEKAMMETLELLCEFVQVDLDFNYMVDLIAAKDDILKNLRYIYDEKIVSVFEEQYNLAIKKLDVSALKDLLESTQGLILKHWEEYLTKIEDYKPGEPFNFLCHSLTRMFEGDFHSKIISMSLLTDKLFDVFSEEYGFIMPSTNIIAASSTDMFINNFADTDDNILYYSTIKRISVPERLVEECLNLKKAGESENNDKVYSEVAKRGFNPKAIFCLTDGSKSLDENYVCAWKLHENFPELKVIEIDKTLYITEGQRLVKIKENLVYNLTQIIRCGDIEDFDEIKKLVKIGAYDGFWAEYMELKKRTSYNEADIISLFTKYEKLIKDYSDIDNMFESLNREDLDIFLKYNPNTGIWAVLNGNPKDYFEGILKFDFSDLERIYNNLKQYAGDERLNDIIPGLARFLQLYGSISFTDLCDNAKLRICSCNNFVDINHILLSYLQKKDLERLGYGRDNHTLDNPELMEMLNSSLPMILELEEMINSKAKAIMEYLNAGLFIEKNEDFYPYYYHWKNDLKKLYQYDQEIENIVSKKTLIQESNAAIAKEIEELQSQLGDNLMKIKKLNKKRLNNGVKYDKLLKEEEQCKLYKAQFEKDFNGFKLNFKSESGYDYDDFDSFYTHALEVVNKYALEASSEREIGLVSDKKELDKQFEEILNGFGLTIGQLHDYVEKYYDNGPTGPIM